MSPLLAAALVVLFEGLCVASLFPVMYAYCAELGGGVFATGVMFALVALPKLVLNPYWGHLADRVGRRRVLVIITLGTMAGSILWAFSTNLMWLAVSRAVVGIFGAQAVLAYAIASDVSTPQRRAAAMGMLGASFGVALTFGPIAGGLVGRHISNAAVGWLGAGFQLVSLLVILLALSETRPKDAFDAKRARDWLGIDAARELLTLPAVRVLLATTLLMTIGYSVLTTSLGAFTEQLYRFTTDYTGYAFALLGIVTALTQGGGTRAAVRAVGELRTTVAGLVALAAGFAGLALQPPLALGILAGCLLSIGVGLAVPCLTAMLSQAVDARRQGGIHGVSQAVTGLGRALGYLLGGMMFSRLGASAPFATAALLSLAGLAVLLGTRAAAAPRTSAERQPEVSELHR